MDSTKSSAPAHPSPEHHDPHLDQHDDVAPDERPHVCNGSWITIGQIGYDPETGEEVEEYALYLCRKYAERS
jgi:hypothetical protein